MRQSLLKTGSLSLAASLILLAAAGDTLQPWDHLRAYGSYAKGLELLGVEFGLPASLFALGVPPRPLK